jgi:hypothetical protein
MERMATFNLAVRDGQTGGCVDFGLGVVVRIFAFFGALSIHEYFDSEDGAGGFGKTATR